MSPYEEAMDAYSILMQEAKGRLSAINTSLAGRTGLPSGTICEFCFLQLRMLCELITLGCLTAHGPAIFMADGSTTAFIRLRELDGQDGLEE